MLCNSKIQPKLFSMVKLTWNTTKMKMLTISPCCAILKSNPNCSAWWNTFGRVPKWKRWQFHHVVQFCNPTNIVQHGEIHLEDYQNENVDNFTMLCNSEIQPKLYSMVKFIWKTTKRKTLAISSCWTGLNWFEVGWNPFQSMKYSKALF